MLFFLILILSLIASCILPWWIVAVVSFLASFFIGKTAKQTFWSGFLATFLAWILIALFKTIPNDNILAKRVAAMFHLPHWALILFITALIGGIVAGMSALSGYYVKKAFKK
jgi:hypothetical protein